MSKYALNATSPRWSNEELNKLKQLCLENKTFEEIGIILSRSKHSVAQKIGNIGLKLNRNNAWTEQEIEKLKQSYEYMSTEGLIQAFPCHSIGSINMKAKKLGLKRKNIKKKIWRDEEIKEINKLYNEGYSVNKLSKIFNRSPMAISSKLEYNFLWTDEEVHILKKYYTILNNEEMEELLPNRNSNMITKKANKLGLYKKDNWNKEELNILKENYPNHNTKYLSKLLPNKTIRQIKRRAWKLNLKRRENWTDEEIKKLCLLYKDTSFDELLKIFPNRDLNSIKNKAKNLNLKRPLKLLWKKNEIKLLKEKYSTSTIEELNEIFPNKTKSQIKNKAKSLRLTKDIDTLYKCFGIKEGGKLPKMPKPIQIWRLSVLKRDEYICKECGLSDKSGKKLQAHHIIPRRDCQEKIYDIDNGITLCLKCHKKTLNNEYEYINKYLSIVKGDF